MANPHLAGGRNVPGTVVAVRRDVNEPAPNAVWHRRLAIGAAALIAAFYFGSLFAFGNAGPWGWHALGFSHAAGEHGRLVEARLRVAISSQTRMLGIDMNRLFAHTHHHHHPSWVG
jgi:hypothetical protein